MIRQFVHFDHFSRLRIGCDAISLIIMTCVCMVQGKFIETRLKESREML